MVDQQEDKYIQLLRELKARLDKNQPTDQKGYLELLNHYNISGHAAFEISKIVFGTIDQPHYKNFHNKFITLEAYFNLLEYDELQQAREDSLSAKKESTKAIRWAKIAVWVSAIFALIQIILASLEYNK